MTKMYHAAALISIIFQPGLLARKFVNRENVEFIPRDHITNLNTRQVKCFSPRSCQTGLHQACSVFFPRDNQVLYHVCNFTDIAHCSGCQSAQRVISLELKAKKVSS